MSAIEMIDVYNSEYEHIGAIDKDTVHTLGYIHKVLHFLVVREEAGRRYAVFQRRSMSKEFYPGLFDVTASGHFMASEEENNMREVEEEIGIIPDVSKCVRILEDWFEETYSDNGRINLEKCCIYLYRDDRPLMEYNIDSRELAGLYEIEINEALNLFDGIRQDICTNGLEYNDHGILVPNTLIVNIDDFVEGSRYYIYALNKAKRM